MAEIILVQPKAGGFDKVGARLPIGILSIAALPYKKGHSVKIVDQRIDSDWKNTILKHITKETICIGITCMTGSQIKYALEASTFFKGEYAVPVIWGGVHPSLMPKQTLENHNINYIIDREGDITFYNLFKCFKENKNFSNVPGVWYKDFDKDFNTELKYTGNKPFIKTLDILPELPYELINIDDYTSTNFEGGKSIDFVSSRGCPAQCAFCYNFVYNKSRWRCMSAKETVRRLKFLVKKFNIKSVFFQDDNFCVNVKRLKEICEGIIKEKLDIKWGTLGLRIDTAKTIDEELLNLMYKSGCRNVDIGVESGNQEMLNKINKNIKLEDIYNVNEKLSKYNFIIKYTFIIGFPNETDNQRMDSVKLALELVKNNKKAYTLFLIYTPYPGNHLYNEAIKLGFKPPKTLEEWSSFNYDTWAFRFSSWHSKKEILKLGSIAFTSFFANKNVLYKINNKLIKLLFLIYYPIAKFRFKNNFHFLPIDSIIGRRFIE